MHKVCTLERLVIDRLIFDNDENVLQKQLIKYPHYSSYLEIFKQIAKRLKIFKFSLGRYFDKMLSNECITNIIRYTPFRILYSFYIMKLVRDRQVLDLIKTTYETSVAFFKVFDISALATFIFQTDEVCLAAIHKDSFALLFVRDQTFKRCCSAMERDFYAINYVRDQTQEICLKAIEFDYFSFKYVRVKTFEICHAAIKKNALMIRYIDNPCRELCLEAVKQLFYSIAYIKNPSEEVCKAAIKNHVMALKLIENQTKSLCIFAINIDPNSIKYIKNQTNELCQIAFGKDPYSIIGIKNQTFEICIEYFKRTHSLFFIKKLTPQLCEYIINNQMYLFRYSGIIKDLESEDDLNLHLINFKEFSFILGLKSCECKNHNMFQVIKFCLAKIFEIKKWQILNFKSKYYLVYLFE
jgi:hypothetical protein